LYTSAQEELEGESEEDVAEVLDDDAATTLAMVDYDVFAARLSVVIAEVDVNVTFNNDLASDRSAADSKKGEDHLPKLDKHSRWQRLPN
jgi:hypothetical protein